MQTISINTAVPYEVCIGSGLLDEAGVYLQSLGDVSGVMLVADDGVAPLYAGRVEKSLSVLDVPVSTFVFPHGEQQKTPATYLELIHAMAAAGMDRSGVVVALGGGVTGDLAGFAAATYRRGIRWMQMPTTLLAAIDASIGGKTGVNLPTGKNQLGAFHQPMRVLIDCDVFKTLPPDIWYDGFGEGIKYAVLAGHPLFDLLKAGVTPESAEKFIAACVSYKRDIVEQDERDNGRRRLLNLGHTVGHALEQLSGYKIPHGRAVAAGIDIMASACVKHGLLAQSVADELSALRRQYHLEMDGPWSSAELAAAMKQDKKIDGGRISLAAIRDIGDCFIMDLPVDELEAWFS